MPSSNLTSNLAPKLSHTTTKAQPSGPGHYLVPSWMTLEVDGTAKFDGAVTMTGAVANSGNVNHTGTFAIGSGVSISLLQRSVISVSPGAVAAHDSVITTATISTMPADALILGVQQASIWSGAYYDLAVNCNVSAVSTLQIGIANSTITSVTPAAMNWTITWMDPA
jgi:hypothetical protein